MLVRTFCFQVTVMLFIMMVLLINAGVEGTDEKTDEGTNEETSEGTNEEADEGTSKGTDEETNEGTSEGADEKTDEGTMPTAPSTTFITTSFTTPPIPPISPEVCEAINSTTGTYEALSCKWIEQEYSRDEGMLKVASCEVKNEVPEECESSISDILNSTYLHIGYPDGENEIHGERVETESRKLQEEDKDGVTKDLMKFSFRIHYKKHHYKRIYCKASYHNLTIISNSRAIGQVAEKWNITVTPPEIETTVGERFTLTCHTKHEVAVAKIVWKRQPESQDYSWVSMGHKNSSQTTVNLNSYSNDTSKQFYSTLVITEESAWSGLYKCTTVGSHAYPPYDTVSVVVKAKDERAVHGAAITVGLLAGIAIVVGVVLIWRRRVLQRTIAISNQLLELREIQNAAQQGTQNAVVDTTDPNMNCYISDGVDGRLGAENLDETFARFTNMYGHWQKDRSTLMLKNVLGEGNFGSVILGIMPDIYMQGISSQVAVKTIKVTRLDAQAIKEFEKEVEIMTNLRHANIVSLLGLCTETMPLYIIMEYMENGQLNQFLMERAPNKLEGTNLATKDLLFMGLQPCRAIEYLSDKNIVHRDISARNCLVGDQLVVKLADFGLSRGTGVDDGKNYYKKDGGMVPVKWMSPEALTFGKYTSANDVWAFGILMWEIFSFGAIPYQGLTNQQVIVFVNMDRRLEKPSHCPESVWRHIRMCWTQLPSDRITIGGLVNMLSTELDIITSSNEWTTLLSNE